MSDPSDRSVSEPVEMPAAVARALERAKESLAQSEPFNAMELRRELSEMHQWGGEPGSSGEKEKAQQRMQAQNWAQQELDAWAPEPSLALYRLQIVLTTLLMSSSCDRDAMQVVWQEVVDLPLLDGLDMLLKVASMGIHSHHRHRPSEDRWREDALAAGRRGDFSSLGHLVRHQEVELSPDAHLATMLLARFAPDRLARHIEEKNDLFFSVAVRDALADDAAKFSLLVNNVTFKFICASPLADARVANAPEGSVTVVRDLLLQVAQTDLWRAWLLDFARYPKGDTVGDRALSEALAQLTPAHWSAFVDAVELWTHAPTARAVASILVPFQHALGSEKSAEMWRLAYERWNDWDYDRGQKDRYLSAPAACSFDFPVSMYYALLPLDEVRAEEGRLLEGIATVERKWFTDLSALVTYRNRLSSRLRLVQHGLAIRNPPPEGADPLPPRIEPDSEFAEFRYRFFDVYAQRRH